MMRYGGTGFIARTVRAMRLDHTLYQEVADDRRASAQATLVVLIGAVATWAGGIAVLLALGGASAGFVLSLLVLELAVVIAWLVWTGVTWLIGTRLLRGQMTIGAAARALGFAQAPAMLRFLAFAPGIGIVVQTAVLIWVLAAALVSVKVLLGLKTVETIVTTLAGYVAYLLLTLLVPDILLIGVAAVP